MIQINLMPKPCQLQIGNVHLEFNRYDNPEKARKILSNYFEGFTLNDYHAVLIENIVLATRKCTNLDIKLDKMFSQSGFPYPRPCFGGGGSSGPLDEDSGYYNVARKHNEENTCHDAYLVQ